MQFTPYIYDCKHEEVVVNIRSMTESDAELTNHDPKWQSSWTSDFLKDENLDKYAFCVDKEIVGLAAYEVCLDILYVHLIYMESHPESNPVINKEKRKYFGIGKLMIAYGIKISIDNELGGGIVLEAKTTELENNYIKNYNAIRLPKLSTFGPPRYLISDEAAVKIFSSYLTQN